MARLNYTDIYIDLVETRMEEVAHYRSMGATLEEIAKMLGITRHSLDRMSKKFPEFGAVLKNNKAKLVMKLEKKVIEKALDGDNVCLFAALSALSPDVWGQDKNMSNKPSVTIVNDLKQIRQEARKALPVSSFIDEADGVKIEVNDK